MTGHRRKVPLGIRNRNPGNIKYNPANDWVGQTGHDDAGFCTFDTAVDGIRALIEVLYSYSNELPSFTPRAIVDRYCTDSALIKADYVSEICEELSCKPDEVLAFNFVWYWLVVSIITFENGEFPYTYRDIYTAYMTTG